MKIFALPCSTVRFSVGKPAAPRQAVQAYVALPAHANLPACFSLRLRKLALLLLVLVAATTCGWAAKDEPRSFSLSSTRTYAPGESVKIQLFAHNVSALEFRVYKIHHEEKFFAALKDLHSFGLADASADEEIDQKTLLERIHDFKVQLWSRVRHFFRNQFNDDARDSFREAQGKLGKRSRVLGVSEFARVPLLNPSQLVARWKMLTPPTLVSETTQLPLEGLASGVYLVEATDGTYKAYTVVIVTRIAVVERTVAGKAELYVADRKTGAPVAGASVVLYGDHKRQSAAEADANGLATLTLGKTNAGQQPDSIWILAKSGPDAAIVTPWSYGFAEDDEAEAVGDYIPPSHTLTAYVYTDRPVYRPGHTVHVKAVLRQKKDDALLLPGPMQIQLKLTDAENKTILKQEQTTSAHGTITADFDLEKDAGLGYYSVELTRDGRTVGYGNFYVEEYKKPEYQVSVKPTAARVLQGNKLSATLEARYFFGEPVAAAKVKYSIHTSTHYWWNPDERDDSENSDEASDSSGDGDYSYSEAEQQEHEGTLDANGRLTVEIPTRLNEKQTDQDYRIEAHVTDAAGREVIGHATVLATYGSFRLSVEPVSYVAEPGKPVQVRVQAIDYDNHPVRTAVHLAMIQTRWDSVTHERNQTSAGSANTSTAADGTALVDLPIAGSSGSFEVLASATTPEQRTVKDSTYVWVWQGSGQWYNQNVQAQIVADKKSYAVGDTAHLLLVSGLKECWAVVTTEGETMQSRQLVHATSESFAIDLPITKLAQPNLIVNAVIVHENQLLTAQKSLHVPLLERRLTITATPGKLTYLPGEHGSFDVVAKDWKGNPAEADLSFGAVDEALYQVRPDTTGDIVASFYPRHYANLDPQTSFEFFFSGEAGLKNPLLAGLNAIYHPRLAQVKPGSDLIVPKVRKAFPDTAYWNPNVHTGTDGHARVDFTFPDALTTWRATVRGMTDDGKAGSVVTRVLVRKNLIVRLAAPRFLRQGDQATLRVIAHNYLDSAKEVSFTLNMQGVELVSGQTQKIVVPAKGESFVDWRVKASGIGSAVLTASALTNEESDALELTIPVLAYGVKQRSTESGIVFSGTGQSQWKYGYPQNTDPASRSMMVAVAPSVAATALDALDYLTSFPWGCTEQTMSSFLPDVIVAEASDRLHRKTPIDRTTLNTMVRAGVERLNNGQHEDGGWGWWPDDASRVFMTAYVVAGLGEAQHAGYSMDEGRLARGRKWLQAALAAHPNMIQDLQAYVVYALATTGGAPREALDQAWANRVHTSDEGLAIIGLGLNAAGDGRAHEAALLLERKAHVEGGRAYWLGNYDGLMEYWSDTSAETTAMALKLIVREDRSSNLLEKAALWLGEHRTGNYWYSTKQTAMVIAGLTDYLQLSGELSNGSDVEVLLNGQSVGQHHFTPDEAFTPAWKLRLTAAQVASGGQLTVRKSGNGITYWSAENQWFSADRKLYQQGQISLSLARDYSLLVKHAGSAADAITWDLQPLRGPVHVGDVIAVHRSMAGNGWKYLLMEDPIPAGAEYAGDPQLYHVNSQPAWWSSWASHKEQHDDRVGYFYTEFDGRHESMTLLKITTPGRFVVSPATASPMYQPGVQATTDPFMLEVLP